MDLLRPIPILNRVSTRSHSTTATPPIQIPLMLNTLVADYSSTRYSCLEWCPHRTKTVVCCENSIRDKGSGVLSTSIPINTYLVSKDTHQKSSHNDTQICLTPIPLCAEQVDYDIYSRGLCSSSLCRSINGTRVFKALRRRYIGRISLQRQ